MIKHFTYLLSLASPDMYWFQCWKTCGAGGYLLKVRSLVPFPVHTTMVIGRN